jgi:hypothetical protein
VRPLLAADESACLEAAIRSHLFIGTRAASLDDQLTPG